MGDDLYSYGFDGAYLWTGTFLLVFVLTGLSFVQLRTIQKIFQEMFHARDIFRRMQHLCRARLL